MHTMSADNLSKTFKILPYSDVRCWLICVEGSGVGGRFSFLVMANERISLLYGSRIMVHIEPKKRFLLTTIIAVTITV